MRSNKDLLIVGGGFAGTKVAQVLETALPATWTVTLISQENFITFNPLLPEVVGASILPGHVIAPHRQMVRRARVCMAQVTELDFVDRLVCYLGEGPGILHYDQLVLYLLRIPTLARKARLFLEWNWAMFFPPDIAHQGYRRTQRRQRGAAPVSESPEQPKLPASSDARIEKGQQGVPARNSGISQ